MQPPLQINPNNVKITRQTPITSAGLGWSKVRLFEASNLARMPCEKVGWFVEEVSKRVIDLCPLSISINQWQQHSLKHIWEPRSHPKVQYAAFLPPFSYGIMVNSLQFRDSVGWGGYWDAQTVAHVTLNPASCCQSVVIKSPGSSQSAGKECIPNPL